MSSDSEHLAALLSQLSSCAPEDTALREQLLYELCCVGWTDGRSTLHAVTEAGMLDIIPLLIERTQSFLEFDDVGNYPLDLVPTERLEETARVFLTAIRKISDEAGRAIGLYLLGSSMVARQWERAKAYIRAGVPVEEARWEDRTPLHIAARFGQEDLIALILSHGAELEARDKNGCTALHYAAHNGHEGAIRRLLELGANPDAQATTGETPADTCKAGLHVQCAVLLLEASFKRKRGLH